MTMFVMTLGELDYSTNFMPWDNLTFAPLTNFLFVVLVLMMPIILMNMLVSQRMVHNLVSKAFSSSKMATGVKTPRQGFENTPQILEHFVALNMMKYFRFVWATVSDARKELWLPIAGNNLRKRHFSVSTPRFLKYFGSLV